MMHATDPNRSEGASLRVLAIVGPTASGKSDVAIRVALQVDGEIVSADSMQVYRGMDIGTAKPRPSGRIAVHHCLDLVDPDEPFSVARYQACARAAIEDVAARGKLPIVCGGTGLYVRAALDDFSFPAGEATNPLRERIERLAETVGPHALHDLLAQRDPASAALIHPNNVRRTIRALEMAEYGVSYAEQAQGFRRRESIYDTTFVGLTMDRAALYRRIDERVDAMISSGLLDEVAALLSAGYRDALTAAQAIGYKELVPVIEQGAPLSEAVAAIKRATRRYAKRQLTWFRSDPRIRWLDVTDRSPEQTARDIVGMLESSDITQARQ